MGGYIITVENSDNVSETRCIYQQRKLKPIKFCLDFSMTPCCFVNYCTCVQYNFRLRYVNFHETK
jgi:hypothetical protein